MMVVHVDSEAVHCHSAPTLEQWYEVRRLTNLRSEEQTHYFILLLLIMFTGTTALLAEEPTMAFGIGFAEMSFLVSCFMLIRTLIYSYSSRKHRRRTAAEHRGWFAEVEWKIMNNGLHYRREHGEQYDAGFIPWSCFSRSQLTDSMVILHFQDPYDYFVVLAKNWLETNDDWQRVRDLVEQSVGPHDSAAK